MFFKLAELTPVASVSVDYTCTNNSVMVTWSPVSGAKSYTATAVDDRGLQMTCTSQGTKCSITGLNCGQQYVVNVTPVSDSCKNSVNATSASFQTGETQNCSQKSQVAQAPKFNLHCLYRPVWVNWAFWDWKPEYSVLDRQDSKVQSGTMCGF